MKGRAAHGGAFTEARAAQYIRDHRRPREHADGRRVGSRSGVRARRTSRRAPVAPVADSTARGRGATATASRR